MADAEVDIMEPLPEKPSLEGEAPPEGEAPLDGEAPPLGEGEGEGDALGRNEGEVEGEVPLALEEEFVEGVVEDGFGLLYDNDYDDDLFTPVKRYTFTNKNGMTAQIINYGVTITSIRVPDRKGVFDDVVLGFEHLDGYIKNKAAYIGSTIGRVCNRVSNGSFLIGSHIYDISKNVQGSWQLHGGFNGLSFVMWKSNIKGRRVIFSYMSRDGEEGYPGNLLIQTECWLTDDNGLKMVTTATTDMATPVSITNHAYFNLAGHWSGPEKMGEHVVLVNADKYLEVDDEMRPTGEIKHVGTTILDLRIPRLLSRLIPVIPKGGFDHNYCINGGKHDGVRFVARAIHPDTGRVMEVFSDQPCAVVFTARNLPTEDEMEEIPPVEESVHSYRSHEDHWSVEARSPRSDEARSPRGSDGGQSPRRSDGGQSPRNDGARSPRGSDGGQSPRGSDAQHHGARSPRGSDGGQSPRRSDGGQSPRRSDGGQSPRNDGALSPRNDDARSLRSDQDSINPDEPQVPMRKREVIGKNGAQYLKYSAICIEPQAYPDAVNKPHFPSVILNPGETYTNTMVFKFSTLVRTKSIRIEAEENGPELPPPPEETSLGSVRSQRSDRSRHSGDSRRSQRSMERQQSGDVPTVNYSHESQADRDVGYSDLDPPAEQPEDY